MQIAQHSDLDLGVVFKLGVLGWRGQGLPFIKNISLGLRLGVDRYVFFRADTDTDYYRSSRPITDILNRYTCLV